MRLIQRDYSNVSLYDYYFNRESEENEHNASREVKLTDSGRTVYGGGGITPDVKIAAGKEQSLSGFAAAALRFLQFRQALCRDPSPGQEL